MAKHQNKTTILVNVGVVVDTNSVSSGEQQASSTDQASPEIATEVVVTIPLQVMQTSTPSTAQEYS